jgi:outer membrane protein
MKHKLIFAVAVLLAGKGLQAQTTMSLRNCVETALTNNFDVQQRALQAQSDEANWKQSRLNRFPDLNATLGHDFNQGRSIDPFTNQPVTQSFNSAGYGIGSNVVLFNGFAIHNTIKQNAYTFKAAQMDLQQEKDNLTINVILAYLNVLSSSDQLTQAQNQVQLTLKQVERLQVLDGQGAIKPSDLTDLKGQYANDQLAIISAQNALVTAKVTLSKLMNVRYNKDLAVEQLDPVLSAATYNTTADSIFEVALRNLSLVKAADFRIKSAAKLVKVTKGQLYPTLNFGANASTRFSSVATLNNNKINYTDQLNNNLYYTYGFSMRIPIFNALQQRNRIKQAQIQLKTRELAAVNITTQLNLDINQAYENMSAASDRYKTTLDQVNAYEQSFNAANSRFQEGVGTPIDYLTAKNNLDRSNISLIIARYDYVLRSKILDYYQGNTLW